MLSHCGWEAQWIPRLVLPGTPGEKGSDEGLGISQNEEKTCRVWAKGNLQGKSSFSVPCCLWVFPFCSPLFGWHQ